MVSFSAAKNPIKQKTQTQFTCACFFYKESNRLIRSDKPTLYKKPSCR